MESYHLDDTRVFHHQMRLMITNNELYPKVYFVSKVDDMLPQGIIKLTFKQDEYDPRRDNPQLKLADYYIDTGNPSIVEPEPVEPVTTGTIKHMEVNSDGELVESSGSPSLSIGQTYYYSAEFSNPSITLQWRVKVKGDYTEAEASAIERLMVIREVNSTTVSIRPGKSNKLKGLGFTLIACDINGTCESEIDLEVAS